MPDSDLIISSPESQLVVLRQIPIIEDHLEGLKTAIDEKTAAAISLAKTSKDTASIKAIRAELRKEFDGLETVRKAVKTAVMEPYNAFETKYKTITAAYGEADRAMKAATSAVEGEIISEYTRGLVDHFNELKAVHGVPWVPFEAMEINVTLTVAKGSPKKWYAEMDRRLSAISLDVDAIRRMDDAGEVLSVYKQTLSLASAVSTVQERHERAEEERKALEASKVKAEEEKARLDAIEAAAPVVEAPVVEAPIVEEERLVTTFRVKGTMTQLKALKAYIMAEGIEIL